MPPIKFNASQIAALGADYLQLHATPGPTGFVTSAGGGQTFSIATINPSGDEQIALIDQSLVAIAIDPTSDFDACTYVYLPPEAIVTNVVLGVSRIVSVGAPQVGLIASRPADPTTPPPVGNLIGIIANGFKDYGFYDTFVNTFFNDADNPQFVVNLYFKKPPVLPMSRPHKSFTRLNRVGFGTNNHRQAFFGRSRLSVAMQNNGALVGNMTFATYAVYFSTTVPNVRYALLNTQTINSPGGGTVHYEATNILCDAIELRVTGTDGDGYLIDGYVADATQP